MSNSAPGRHKYLCNEPQCNKSDLDCALKRCKGCEIARYCSKTCQIKDWGHHKPECLRLRHIQQTPADANLLHDVNSWFGHNPSVTDIVALAMRSTGLPDARKNFAFHMVVEHNPMQTRKCDRIRVASHALVSWGDLPALGFKDTFAAEMQAQRERMEETAGSVQPYVVLLAVQAWDVGLKRYLPAATSEATPPPPSISACTSSAPESDLDASSGPYDNCNCSDLKPGPTSTPRTTTTPGPTVTTYRGLPVSDEPYPDASRAESGSGTISTGADDEMRVDSLYRVLHQLEQGSHCQYTGVDAEEKTDAATSTGSSAIGPIVKELIGILRDLARASRKLRSVAGTLAD
ncbi:uncharacterized protein B0H18DRAFT_954110 [Fomitopsis serialis]|uniref:uncharacterized protein n=1 Tax=Fomitopsis serialis TaxID=139415 RepID=UPI002008A5DE|nr:uncharacterized protein B0H18DRAFT_954110 [Neoantrodia serialis]KAH9928115.1 hypothetical protein B0H18DRAFT_954110 [Neoantrodia serialis]